MSVGLTNRSVDSTPFLRVTLIPKKLTFSLDQYAINLIFGGNVSISFIISFRDSFPYFQIKNISSIYLHETLGFFYIYFKSFPLKDGASFSANCRFTNLFVSSIRKSKNFII